MQGHGLGENVGETDPQSVGAVPLDAKALSDDSVNTATAVNSFVAGAREALKGRTSANMVLLRGISMRPELPNMRHAYRLKPAAIAAYPMYRGLAELVGMDVIATGHNLR